MNKSLIILRGLPGSGKSTLAKVLSEGIHPVFCIDDYFTDANGKYTFEFHNNHLAYKACIDRTAEAMSKKLPKIFLDNTFTMDWEIEPYYELADRFVYTVYVVTVENRHGGKNIHGIGDEQLQKMAHKFEVKLL